MKYRVHYSKGDWKDHLTVEGDDIEEVREKIYDFFASRNIVPETLDELWSEEIKE